jgi:phosphoglucomutase
MAVHSRAGQAAEPSDLIDVNEVLSAYYAEQPDVHVAGESVEFGTSGHRGSSLNRSFNENHILAVSQAVCDYRTEQGIDGPIFVGFDTHALSVPAFRTAVEVFAANGVHVLKDVSDRFTPTPAISHAILSHNSNGGKSRSDGVVITPSHNPPGDGGFKYNGPNGGPADSTVTRWLEKRANSLLANGLDGVKRIPYERAINSDHIGDYDFVARYVSDLASILDMDVIRSSDIRIGADALGGASLDYWTAIADHYNVNLTVVNPEIDPTFRFIPLDWDEKIRMDCSSPYVMSALVNERSHYDIATGNDADADRHGIVTGKAGLLNPNHYLTVAVDYLIKHRNNWPAQAAIGKTLVTTRLIDRLVQSAGRTVVNVPVGFKWFVPYFEDESIVFGGEESAGASFVRRDGRTWTTDKDGIVMALLAAEITAATGDSPNVYYDNLTREFGKPHYARQDAIATREDKQILSKMTGDSIRETTLAGEPITEKFSRTKGNDLPIGGVYVGTESAWFTARPSGTEDVFKIYAESFQSETHLEQVIAEAQEIVGESLKER